MRPLALLFVVAAAALAAWLLWPSGTAPAPSDPSDGSDGSGQAPREAPVAAPGLPRTKPRERRPKTTDSSAGRALGKTVVETGAIRVTISPVEGVLVARTARVEIEALGPEPAAHPLAVAQEDGTFVFDDIPAGRYRIRVMSEGSQEAVGETKVEKDQEAALEIALKPGGSASYAVSLYSGEAPDSVTLALLDGRGLPVGASFQTPTTTVHLAPAQGIALPPTGKVIGLRSGRYTLKATSPEGEADEKTFDAKAGEVVALELRIRK